jgi:chaperonin GroES
MGDFARSVDPKPINGRLLVKIIGNSRRSSGGLYIPETASTFPMQGTVEEVSEGYYDGMVFRNHTVMIGDVIIFDWKAGFYLNLDETEYRIIHENEVLAILREVNYSETY